MANTLHGSANGSWKCLGHRWFRPSLKDSGWFSIEVKTWHSVKTQSHQFKTIKTHQDSNFLVRMPQTNYFCTSHGCPIFLPVRPPRVSPEANSNRAVPVVARWHWQRHLGCAWCAGGEVVLPHHKGYKNIGKLMINQGYSWSFWSRIPIFFCISHTHPNFDGGDSAPCLDSQDGEFTIDLQPCTNEMGKNHEQLWKKEV